MPKAYCISSNTQPANTGAANPSGAPYKNEAGGLIFALTLTRRDDSVPASGIQSNYGAITMSNPEVETLERRRVLDGDYVTPSSSYKTLGALEERPSAIVVSGQLSSPAHIDHYRFSVKPGAVLSFDVDASGATATGLDAQMQLFDATGKRLSSTYVAINHTYRPRSDSAAAPGEQAGVDPYLSYYFKSAGTYILGITNQKHGFPGSNQRPVTDAAKDRRIGGYRLEVSFPRYDDNDQISEVRGSAAAGDVTNKRLSLTGTIDSWHDVDVYSFKATAGDGVTLDLDTAGNGIASALDADLWLFDQSGKTLTKSRANAAFDDVLKTSFTDAAIHYRIPISATYYVAVASNDNGSSIESSPGFDVVTGAELGGKISPERKGSYKLSLISDFGDQLSEAAALGLNSRTGVATTLSHADDVDIFQFSAKHGQRIAIDLDHLTPGRPTLLQVVRFGNVSQTVMSEVYETFHGTSNGRPITERQGNQEPYLEFDVARDGVYHVFVSYLGNEKDIRTGEDERLPNLPPTLPELKYSLYAFAVLDWTTNLSSGSSFTSITGTVRLGDGGEKTYLPEAQVQLRVPSGETPSIRKSRNTWMVTHGRASNPNALDAVAKGAVANLRQSQLAAQVVMLDWSVGAKDNHRNVLGVSDTGTDGAWIERTGFWAARTLKALSITPSQVGVIGHSWGSYVNYEAARIMSREHNNARIRATIALDPARTADFYSPTSINFSRVSTASWAFSGYGAGSPAQIGLYGNASLAATAAETFSVESPLAPATYAGTIHTTPITLVSMLLNNQVPVVAGTSLFSLKRLWQGPNGSAQWGSLNKYYGSVEARFVLKNVTDAGRKLAVSSFIK